MRDTPSSGKVLAGLIMLAIVAALVWFFVMRGTAQQECVDSGGVVHEYNCSASGCDSWQCVKS